MDDGIVCIGVCINDPDTGVCLGCGRRPEPVIGRDAESASASGAVPGARKKNPATPLSAGQYPLPPQVAEAAALSND